MLMIGSGVGRQWRGREDDERGGGDYARCATAPRGRSESRARSGQPEIPGPLRRYRLSASRTALTISRRNRSVNQELISQRWFTYNQKVIGKCRFYMIGFDVHALRRG